MRRPHVYERSAPRLPRNAYYEPQADPTSAARDIACTLAALVSRAELSGLAGLAAALQGALEQAEAAGGRAATVCGPAPA